MVEHSDGIVTHDDLRTRGCRIKVFKRRIGLDEKYRQGERMKCHFLQRDDECVCHRCRTEKWPTQPMCSCPKEDLVPRLLGAGRV